MENYRIEFRSVPWKQPTPGAMFKAHEQDGRRLRIVKFTREFVEPFWCTKGHIGYMLEGEMEVDFQGQTVTFRAGDGLFIPPGAEHGHKARVQSDSVMLVLVESTE